VSDTNSKHILIVEDEEMTARLILYRLKAMGHRVHHASDGIEGFNYIRENKPDLVVLDVMLPGISGFEILQRLQDDENFDTSLIKVLMLSNKKRAEDVSRGFDLGVMEYVPKPFKMEEFLLRLNRVLKQ
jgi:DNA-binding response OmpR family regulator